MSLLTPLMPNENHKGPAEESERKGKIMKNLISVSISIFLVYVPFDSLLNLQSTMNDKYNMGMLSTMISYVATTLSCLFLPKIVTKTIGRKYTIVLSVFAFSPFFAANFYIQEGFFFPSAAIQGIASGILWPTICTYINEISELYAVRGSDTADIVASRFFGIFYFVFNFSQICGNLISYYILKPNALTSKETFTVDTSTMNAILYSLDKYDNVSCGANFCGGINQNLLPPSEIKRYALSSFYVCCSLISTLILFIFMDPIKEAKTKFKQEDSSFSEFIATLNQMRNTDQLLLLPLTIFSGLQQVFIFADYSKAFVACAWSLHNVSLVFVCFGVMCASMSFISGRLIKYLPRSFLMITGAVGNAGVCTVLLMWQPKSDETIYFFILVGIWGVSQGIWFTQISALYGHLFKEDEEAAFIIDQLLYSIACGIGYGCSSYFCMYQKIYILLASLLLGLIGYFTVEIRQSVCKKTCIMFDSYHKQ